MDSNIYLYSGQDKSEIPYNIAHVRCDSSVTEIPESLFKGCRHLVTVELNEGLKVIGKKAFYAQSQMNIEDAYKYSSEIMIKNMMEYDAEEGINAFIDKRKPKWK